MDKVTEARLMEEFHRAGRRRKILVYAVAAVVLAVAGLSVLVAYFLIGDGSGGYDEFRILGMGVVLLIGAGLSGRTSYGIATAKVEDLDHEMFDDIFE